MSDREMLEAAAKVAGYNIEWSKPPAEPDGMPWPISDEPICWFKAPPPYNKRRGDTGQLWDPLTDDGDAFRLAVKLCLMVELFTAGCSVSITTDDDPFGRCLAEERDSDPYAAARRAIVRAAAAMAKEPK